MGKPSGITSRATRVLAVLLLLGILSSSLFHTAWAQEAKPDPTPTPSTSASAAPVSPSPTPSVESTPSDSETPPSPQSGATSDAVAPTASAAATGELPPACNLVPDLLICPAVPDPLRPTP